MSALEDLPSREAPGWRSYQPVFDLPDDPALRLLAAVMAADGTPDSMERPAWWADAACQSHDPNLFFPTRGVPTEPAKAICRDCPVREPCLDHALTVNEEHGIWGGTSARDRKRIRRRRGAA